MIRQRLLALFVTLAATASMVLGVAPVAHAAVVDVACVGTTQVNYSPGLKIQPRSVHFIENDLYTTCTSSDPTIKTGRTVISFTTVLSCLQPLRTGTAPNPITWNNGQTSDLLLNYGATFADGQNILVGNGIVTDGEFQGDSAKVVLTYAQPDVTECLSPQGVTNQIGTATVTINGS
ncbi:hypothetical protein [Streptomyces noursei]|uniref:hypothetical protein n=1 Tax=Streptomyces noursei TaxID=1971 RepID=UPI003820685E